jgi:hypothetical protein
MAGIRQKADNLLIPANLVDPVRCALAILISVKNKQAVELYGDLNAIAESRLKALVCRSENDGTLNLQSVQRRRAVSRLADREQPVRRPAWLQLQDRIPGRTNQSTRTTVLCGSPVGR